MENKMTIFENKEFGRIRTINDEKGEPLFCAKDVCDALGYNNSRDALRKHVEGDDVAKCDTIDTLGRRQFQRLQPPLMPRRKTKYMKLPHGRVSMNENHVRMHLKIDYAEQVIPARVIEAESNMAGSFIDLMEGLS